MDGRRVETEQELRALLGGDGVVVNLAGCGYHWNVVHALTCCHAPRLLAGFGEKWVYRTLEEARRHLDGYLGGPGRHRACQVCLGKRRRR